ncbi:hypothetical protein [Lysinibacillus sp. LZ02]|uniref:hypothetical protein n=1 Tax=Lysinibacillus sp. LZ02 TaxID=3420668 RepID=UPI003D36B5D5
MNLYLFIESSNLGFDTAGNSLVLWQTEKEALTVQSVDLNWQHLLNNLAPENQLQQLLSLPNRSTQVQSILYITPASEAIAIEAFHLIQYPNTNPPKAYFFNRPYTLTFAQAFKLTDDSLITSRYEFRKSKPTKIRT